MEVKAGYKQTDVGMIPDDWELNRVGALGDVRAGKALASRGQGRQRPYLRTQNVFDGRIDLNDVLQMPMTDAEFSRYRLQYGDVLLNEGQSLELVGRCAMYKNEYHEPCAIQNQLVRFRAQDGVSASFAAHLFRYCQTSGVFTKIALQTTSVAHLGVNRLHRLQLACPPGETEQKAIAKALSDADALIESLEQLLTKKRQIKKGAMQELLTGKKRLSGFSKEWETKRLGEFGSTFGGLTGKNKNDFGRGTSRYITFMNIMANVVIDCGIFELVDVHSTESQNQAAKGDVFFNGSSETPEEVGMCAILTQDVQCVYLNSFCFGFRFHDTAAVDGLYIALYFRSQEGRKLLKSLAQGATRYNLSKTALLSVAFPCPSQPEQAAIATVLSDMDAEITALEAKLSKARQLKQGMMQELLTGRIRLL